MPKEFDPFRDRTARDIRNSLSTALVEDLASPGGQAIERTRMNWLTRQVAPVYRDYLRERCKRYADVRADIRQKGISDPRFQAVVLWNAGLFFELHELLETVWSSAGEPERTALKGLIQAAGAYVHCQRGHQPAARNLASRARRHLHPAASARVLGFITNLTALRTALENPELPAPVLKTAGSAHDPNGGRDPSNA